MSSCIICGTSVDGYTCSSHEEDVLFEFTGSRPGQLTPGRYYRGTVDGYADFGVFVDIGDSVTGLLHKSELDGRLESLGWEPGDTVFVQVTGVRDNGNVDLGWSIRQAEREFRGVLVDDPDVGHSTLLEDDEDESGNADGDGASAQSPAAGSDDESPEGVTDDEEATTPTDGGPADSAEDGGETTGSEEVTET